MTDLLQSVSEVTAENEANSIELKAQMNEKSMLSHKQSEGADGEGEVYL